MEFEVESPLLSAIKNVCFGEKFLVIGILSLPPSPIGKMLFNTSNIFSLSQLVKWQVLINLTMMYLELGFFRCKINSYSCLWFSQLLESIGLCL